MHLVLAFSHPNCKDPSGLLLFPFNSLASCLHPPAYLPVPMPRWLLLFLQLHLQNDDLCIGWFWPSAQKGASIVRVKLGVVAFILKLDQRVQTTCQVREVTCAKICTLVS